MGKVGNRSGGGIEGRQVSQVVQPKREPIAHHIDPNRPSQIGMSTHYVKAPLYQSTTATTPFGTTPSVPGPGGGRMVMPSGSQSKTPAPHPMGKGRSLFK
jgi:hypothetical protein